MLKNFTQGTRIHKAKSISIYRTRWSCEGDHNSCRLPYITIWVEMWVNDLYIIKDTFAKYPSVNIECKCDKGEEVHVYVLRFASRSSMLKIQKAITGK